MICVSLAEPSFRDCLKALKGLPMSEIRLDLTPLTLDEVRTVFASPLPLVATFRPGRAPVARRREALATAIASGAAYVDIEAEAPPDYRKGLVGVARKHGCRVILSSHSGRPPSAPAALALLRDRSFRQGADIVKVVRRVRTVRDCARLLALYDTPRATRVIALGTGSLGFVTRVAATFLGAPFTYASLGRGKETAAGQPDWRALERILGLLRHE